MATVAIGTSRKTEGNVLHNNAPGDQERAPQVGMFREDGGAPWSTLNMDRCTAGEHTGS